MLLGFFCKSLNPGEWGRGRENSELMTLVLLNFKGEQYMHWDILFLKSGLLNQNVLKYCKCYYTRGMNIWRVQSDGTVHMAAVKVPKDTYLICQNLAAADSAVGGLTCF